MSQNKFSKKVKVNVRPLKNTDFEIVKKLNDELVPVSTIIPEKLSAQQLKTMFRRGRTKFSESRIVETDKGSAIGFLYTVYDGDFLRKKFINVMDLDNTLYLFCIAIKKAYQNKGYGKLLWEETMKIAEKHNKSNVLLCVNNRNEIAHAWYKRLGFFELASTVWMVKKMPGKSK